MSASFSSKTFISYLPLISLPPFILPTFISYLQNMNLFFILPIHPSLTLLPLGNHDSVLYGLDPIFKQLCNTPYLHTQCVTRFLKVKACPNQALDREEGSVVQENVLRTTLQKMYCWNFKALLKFTTITLSLLLSSNMGKPPQVATVSMTICLPTKMAEKAKTWWILEQSDKAWSAFSFC